ncbi:peptide chain release factor N(5)-glutamine methyltransferase [Brevibacillus fluminis]|uniref:Release factor glutamine methyltransferase n=1 Tax=Brevibacillus fluminis TaxID=511487 RepID=A0A3M8D3J2_9BACL|nr:peptide chain release factor N(5)-glutamine methyltransferase [Brevibacillus fluminis]RNB82027.1 peptide chain release factor N(5)-glutamine methyltransferase [Brevibacillus fluminis]
MVQPTTIREALLRASSFLQEHGCRDPRFEAELLLRHVLDMERASFLASLPDPMPDGAAERFQALCERRAAQEPLQYVIGTQEFFGREFLVRPGVLIPRPETEILIEKVLQYADRMWTKESELAAVDIGTGSGAIALTLASERPLWAVSTVDLSTDAIEIARDNAKRLGLGDKVRFLHGDLLEPLLLHGEQVDVLVSNPPYIPSSDVLELDREVKEYEPLLALDGGEDGLNCYRRLCEALPAVLKEQALVAFEVGIHQAQDVARLMMASGVIDETAIVPDLAGIDRIVVGVRKQKS